MRGGLLCATDRADTQAHGTAISDVVKGEDIGITNIEGIIPIHKGAVTILLLVLFVLKRKRRLRAGGVREPGVQLHPDLQKATAR